MPPGERLILPIKSVAEETLCKGVVSPSAKVCLIALILFQQKQIKSKIKFSMNKKKKRYVKT